MKRRWMAVSELRLLSEPSTAPSPELKKMITDGVKSVGLSGRLAPSSGIE